LNGGRGTVEQWLQYSFSATPGATGKEEWTSGAVEGNVYLVQYRIVWSGNTAPGPSPSYVFEAHLSRKIVRGTNPPARELLAGASRPQARRAKKKKAPAPRKKKAPKKHGFSQLPLPSDDQLKARSP
jgi:hypothetical protein